MPISCPLLARSATRYITTVQRSAKPVPAEEPSIAENQTLKLCPLTVLKGLGVAGSVHISFVDSKTKQMLGVIEYVRDITEWKKTEEALKESEEKYRMLIENIQDGVFIIQDAKIKFLNEAFGKNNWLYSRGTCRDRYTETIAPEDLDIVMDRYQQRLAGKDVPKEYEFLMLHKDGVTRVIVNTCLSALLIIRAEQQAWALSRTSQNIKRWKQNFRKHRNWNPRILAGGIAHDFNNILTAITGNISLAKMYAQPE